MKIAFPLILLSALGTFGSCNTSQTASARVQDLGVVELHPRWDSLGRFAFERWALAALPEGSPRAFSSAQLATLAAALNGFDERALRAAVLLARSDDGPAATLLIERLERRELGPERDSDAADIVAAAGLGTHPNGKQHAARLAALAIGETRHPDLEVRVECAATALAAGHDEVQPFLLRVLRERTPAGTPETRDWEPTTTMAWSKSRAAEALSRAAGTPVQFSADASVADQMAQATALEEQL